MEMRGGIIWERILLRCSKTRGMYREETRVKSS